jgi:hypothetical protein
MKDGRSLTGIVKQQDDKSVTVITQNELAAPQRNSVAATSELSMMPEGLLAPLPTRKRATLLYYLSRPGRVPLPGETK